ncbi:MAG: thiamine-phosphate kinase [Cytophagaceae bacterium]|jgi:thiamine-monophosphate kinase|nr:thiamine-phosphate kinase [Cytophagaceae bacterium]
MQLSEIGEFGFINRIVEKFKTVPSYFIKGIGDDCAIIPYNDVYDYVITTDMLVEDVHFIRSRISPHDLGHKTLAVNLSDVAAMGAKSAASFLSIAIPPSIDVEYLDSLMNGYFVLSEKYGVPLLGGDTTRSLSVLALNVTVIGIVEKGKARLRSMAYNGDVICVTGFLGDSAGGLKVFQNNIPLTDAARYLALCHNRPQPAVEEGMWLAKQTGVNAMMDVSDGIASDLKHILKASGKSAVAELKNIPLSPQLQEVSQLYGFDVTELAVSGGEDYHLLVTIAKEQFAETAAAYRLKFGKELYAIGSITAEDSEPAVQWLKDGKPVEVKGGFNHFGE